MEFLAVVVLFPLLLAALCLGCGLLIGAATGTRLPALLILPLGFGTLIVVSQFTTWDEPSAPWTPWILLLLTLAGFGLARKEIVERWRSRPRGWWWCLAAGVVAYGIVAAPEIVAARVTFTAYLLDTTGAIQIAGAERLLHHGHNFSGGLLPGYGSQLAAYFGNGYPSGGHGVLASVGWLSGQNLLWLYSPFQAAELGIAALGLAFLARTAGLSRPYAAVAGVVAAIPALVYAYALMGSIKELTALPMLVLMGGLIAYARPLRVAVGWRAVLPFAVAAAAALGAVGLAASVWVGLFGLAALLAATPPISLQRLRVAATGGAWLAAGTAIVALPTVARLSQTLTLAESVTNSNSRAAGDPGNLLRPLKFVQTLGVWLGESHRVDPRYFDQTYALIGIVIVCVALGLFGLVRRRSWSVLAFVMLSFLSWAILHSRGTTWTDAKILMLLSPVVVLVALIGAFGMLQRWRWEGVVLVVAVVGGVLASDALLYHGTNLAPTSRYRELGAIEARYAGQRPTLTPDFDEYSMYVLRDMGPDGPGLPYPMPFAFVGGAAQVYGHSYDLDQLALSSVESFRMIAMRRSPSWSRPPGNFKEVWNGPYYTTWRREGPAPIAHFPLGGSFTPSALPRCGEVHSIAMKAAHTHAQIAYVRRPINISANLSSAYRSPDIGATTDFEGRPQYVFGGPGQIKGRLKVKTPGGYELWLAGSIDRTMRVLIDGHEVGAPSQESGDDGNVIHVADISLSAGAHSYELLRGQSNLAPDQNGSTAIDGLVLQPAGAIEAPVRTIEPSRWRSLCGQPLDWIEIG